MVEQCSADKIIVKPQKLGLPLDLVLFDKNGQFIGPVSEIVDKEIDPKYVIRVSEDMIHSSKRNGLRPGDRVYYYNCDRLREDRESMLDELSLVAMKGESKNRRKTGKNQVSKQIMKGVIEDLREMRLSRDQDSAEDCMEEEQKSNSKNTRSIASIVLKSCFNRKTVGNQLEKQKARRYKRIKARILGDLCKYQEEKHVSKVIREEEIEDELELGKRKTKSKTVKRDSLINVSTDYSKKSFDHERFQEYNLEIRRSSDNPLLQNFNETELSKLRLSDHQMNKETIRSPDNPSLAYPWKYSQQQ